MKRFLGIPVLGLGIQTLPDGVRLGRLHIQLWAADLAVLYKRSKNYGSFRGLRYMCNSAFNYRYKKSSVEVTCFYFTLRITDTKYMYLRVKR